MSINLEELQCVRNIGGIYFLFKGENLVYIGQSNNIYVRLLEHKYEGKKNFDNFKCFKVEDLFKREIYEIAFISIEKPKYNKLVVDDFNEWVLPMPIYFKEQIFKICFRHNDKIALHSGAIIQYIDDIDDNGCISLSDCIDSLEACKSDF